MADFLDDATPVAASGDFLGGAKPVQPAGPTKYQKYFATPAAAAVAASMGPLGALFSKGPGGTPPPAGGSGRIPEVISQNIVGQTPTQSLANAASMGGGALIGPGTGLAAKIARPIARTAITAGGGALGSLAEGKSPISGAIQGGTQQIMGEMLAPVLNLVGRVGRSAKTAQTLEEAGQKLSTVLPGIKPTNPDQLDTTFRHSQVVTKMGQRLGGIRQEISNKVGNAPIIEVKSPFQTGSPIQPPPPDAPLSTIPGRGQPRSTVPITFQEAIERLTELNDKAKYKGPEGAMQQQAVQARRAGYVLRQQIKEGLNKVEPGLGDYHGEASTQYGIAKLMRDIFSEPKVWPRKGGIDMGELQELVSQRGAAGYRDELRRVLGDEEAQKFIDVIRQHAKGGAGTDMPFALNIFMRQHGIGVPSIGMHPHLGQSIGPPVRRFPKLPPAVPGLAAGAALSDVLNGMTGNQQ